MYSNIDGNVASVKAYLHTKWHLDPSSCLATTGIGRKLGGSAPWGWSWVRIKHNVASVKAYLHTNWHLDPSSQLATINMGQKVCSGAVLLFQREVGPHLTQCGEARGLPAYQVSFWSIQLFGYNTPTLQDRTDTQTGQTTVWYHRANCFINSRPKSMAISVALLNLKVLEYFL